MLYYGIFITVVAIILIFYSLHIRIKADELFMQNSHLEELNEAYREKIEEKERLIMELIQND